MTGQTQDVMTECTDFAGRRVYLSVVVAEHIGRRHPEMGPFLGYICEVLERPDFVYERARVPSYLYYRLGILTGRLSNTYLVAVVRYNDANEGVVRTMYPTTQPASGDTLSYVRPRRGLS